MQPIFVALKAEHFARFEAGSKSVELRGIYDKNGRRKSVAAQVMKAGPHHEVTLSLGFTMKRLHGYLGRVWRSNGVEGLSKEVRSLADLGPNGSALFKPGEPLLAFQVLEYRKAVPQGG